LCGLIIIAQKTKTVAKWYNDEGVEGKQKGVTSWQCHVDILEHFLTLYPQYHDNRDVPVILKRLAGKMFGPRKQIWNPTRNEVVRGFVGYQLKADPDSVK